MNRSVHEHASVMHRCEFSDDYLQDAVDVCSVILDGQREISDCK